MTTIRKFGVFNLVFGLTFVFALSAHAGTSTRKSGESYTACVHRIERQLSKVPSGNPTGAKGSAVRRTYAAREICSTK